MCSVSFLPQELQGSDEWLSAHLPAVYVCPLIQLQGQVAMALDPLRKHVIHHGL